ncbi:MAG: clpC [Candidatus Levybacteria bacterium]|nr:clpC [Candidatus Levybacteria bacterium]
MVNNESAQDALRGFSEPARKTMRVAQEIAVAHRHRYIRTEHILLALIANPANIASRLIETKTENRKVKDAIEFVIIGDGDTVPTGKIEITERSKKIIELAVDEARGNGDAYIGTKHLLFGIIREGEGAAAGVLHAYGIDEINLPELIKRGKELSTQFPAEDQPTTEDKLQEDISRVFAKVNSVFINTEIETSVKVKLLANIERITELAKKPKEKQNPQG